MSAAWNKAKRIVKNYNLPLKTVNLILLLLSWTWIVTTSSLSPTISLNIEPIGTFISALVTLVLLEMGSGQDGGLEADRENIKLFIENLPSNGETIQFLSLHGKGDAFADRHLSVLGRFSEEWSVPEREFHDSELEQKRAEIVNLVTSFMDVASVNTWLLNNDMRRVPAEWMYEQPQRWKEVVDQLSSLSREIVIVHKDLIRLARQNLHI